MLGNLFRQRTHYVYNYKPRYYDERKERLKSPETREGASINFNSDLKSKWTRAKKSTADRNANKRLAIIIAILVGIAAYIFDIHSLF